MIDMPERIKAWTWNASTDSGQWHVNGRGETTEYVRADLPPSWLANCFKCGRVVDTREREAGGDDHGCQLNDGRWLCSSECWHEHLLKRGDTP